MVHNARSLDPATLETALEWLLAQESQSARRNRAELLDDCIDVANFVAATVLSAAAKGR